MLPSELLSECFKGLNEVELGQALFVCTRWKTIAQEDQLWVRMLPCCFQTTGAAWVGASERHGSKMTGTLMFAGWLAVNRLIRDLPNDDAIQRARNIQERLACARLSGDDLLRTDYLLAKEVDERAGLQLQGCFVQLRARFLWVRCAKFKPAYDMYQQALCMLSAGQASINLSADRSLFNTKFGLLAELAYFEQVRHCSQHLGVGDHTVKSLAGKLPIPIELREEGKNCMHAPQLSTYSDVAVEKIRSALCAVDSGKTGGLLSTVCHLSVLLEAKGMAEIRKRDYRGATITLQAGVMLLDVAAGTATTDDTSGDGRLLDRMMILCLLLANAQKLCHEHGHDDFISGGGCSGQHPSMLQASLFSYEQAEAFARCKGDVRRQLLACGSQGLVHRALLDFNRAEVKLQRCVELCDEHIFNAAVEGVAVNTPVRANYCVMGKCTALGNLGSLLNWVGRYTDAACMLCRAIALLGELYPSWVGVIGKEVEYFDIAMSGTTIDGITIEDTTTSPPAAFPPTAPKMLQNIFDGDITDADFRIVLRTAMSLFSQLGVTCMSLGWYRASYRAFSRQQECAATAATAGALAATAATSGARAGADDRAQARAASNIGNLLVRIRQYPEAEVHLRRQYALALAAAGGNARSVADPRGLVLDQTLPEPSEQAVYQVAAASSQSPRTNVMIDAASNNLGNLMFQMGQIAEAEKMLSRSCSLHARCRAKEEEDEEDQDQEEDQEDQQQRRKWRQLSQPPTPDEQKARGMASLIVLLATLTMHSPYTHHTLTMHSPYTHHALTMHSPYTHHALTMHSPYTHHAITMHSLYTHHALTMHSPYTHHALNIH
jgi:tetratricopeptide (TPR) repeat protein